MCKLDNLNTTPTPPSPEIMTTNCCIIEEMSSHLFDVQRNIQDMLEAVCNPMGKRKLAGSNNYDDVELRSPAAYCPIP
jgi:hypothetical protein